MGEEGRGGRDDRGYVQNAHYAATNNLSEGYLQQQDVRGTKMEEERKGGRGGRGDCSYL